MKFVSFFSGIGGIDRGFELAGMECVAQIENNKECRQVLQAHWPKVQRFGDIEALYEDSIPQADLFCGGFPCQDLSVAGRRAGLNGDSSRLFFEFCRIIEARSPRWIVVENVPGLLSSHKGRDMGTLVRTLEKLGYGVSWRVLDLRYFGVPQRRRRLFFVGCRRSLRSSGEVLLDPTSLRQHPPKIKRKRKEVTVRSCNGTGSRSWPTNIDQVLVGFSENQRAEVLESPIMRALTVAQGKMAPKIRIGLQVRRLMPIECERLQGFPDGWTAMLTDSHRYKTLGNAVGVPVAHWLGIRIQAAEVRRKDRIYQAKMKREER